MDQPETTKTQPEDRKRDGVCEKSCGHVRCDHFDPECKCNSYCVCHEPWEDFKTRVLKLCSQTWFGYRVEVEPAANSDSHRAAKIKLFFDDQICEYIVRALVENLGGVDILQRVANLEFAELHSLGAPRVESFRHGYFNNAMDMPYVLQEFIRGQSMAKVLPGLTHKQALSLATAWGSFCKNWLATAARAHAPGRLDPSCPLDKFGKPRIMEYPAQSVWFLDDLDRETAKCRPVEESLSTCDWLWSQYRRHFNVREDLLELEWDLNEHFDVALRATEQMERIGMFENDYYIFDHGSLTPEKIFVDVEEDVVTITGILGWEKAGFAPQWCICKRQTWFWETEASDDEDEKDDEYDEADDEYDEADNEYDEADETEEEDNETDDEKDETDDSDPYIHEGEWKLSRWRNYTRKERQREDPEGRAISEAFNTAAGEDFSSYARQLAYRHARKLASVAITGCSWTEKRSLAAHLHHWEEYVFPWLKASYRARRGSVASSVCITSALKDSNASRNAFDNPIRRQLKVARARRWKALFPDHRRLLHARQKPGSMFDETVFTLSDARAPPGVRWIMEHASDVEGSDSGGEAAGSADLDSDSDGITNSDLGSDSDSD